jgi:hypothetical protein
MRAWDIVSINKETARIMNKKGPTGSHPIFYLIPVGRRTVHHER